VRALAPTLAAVSLLLACGPGPEGDLEAARERLAAGDYAGAADAASRGLAAGAEGATAWRLELAALEGEARSGRTAEVLARLERLAAAWPQQLTGALYVQTAGQLKEGGDAAGAIGVLDAGARRYPGDADITRAIEQAKASGSDAEIERLRSLGYVE
jgi:hypothetical protein